MGVYRPSFHQAAPQVFRPKAFEPYTLRWLFDRATQQYVRLTQPGGGWDAESIPYGQSPAVVTGDVMVGPQTTTPGGYSVTLGDDGVLIIDAGGDSSRQLVSLDIYDSSLASFYGAATFPINDQAPVAAPLGNTVVLNYNVAMTTFDLAAQFTDAELDTLTYAVTSGSEPSGTSVDSAGQWTGTPDTVSTGSFVLTATDPYGVAGTLSVDWAVLDQVAVPDVDNEGTTEGAARAAILDAFLVPDSEYEYSTSVLEGFVIRQDPAPGSLVSPGSTVVITVSRGPQPRFVPSIAPRRTRRRPYL